MSDSLQKTSKYLRKIGFSDNEAHIYLYLVESGGSTAFEVAKNTKIPRATAYLTLEYLKNRNLVSSSKKNKVAYFYAESIKRLKDSFKEKMDMIEEIIPEISALGGINKLSPKTSIFTGIQGVKFVWDDILNVMEGETVKQLYALSSSDVFEIHPRYFKAWLKRREAAGIFTRLIAPINDPHPDIMSNIYRESRYIKDDFPFKNPINIYGNKVAFFAFKDAEPYSIIVDSPAVAATLKKVFMYIWNTLPENKKPDLN